MNSVEVIGLGEVVIDWVAQINHFPRPDEKLNAISENYFPGGVTANYLVAISRLGAKSGFIGAVGDDQYGDMLIADFKKENIDTTLTIKKKRKKTPVNFIFITNGEKTIIQSPKMYTTKLDPQDIEESYLKSGKILHTTLIHQNLSEKAIKMAKKNNLKVSIDLEPQIAERGWERLRELLLKADVVIPNKQGAKIITNNNSVKKAAKNLVKKGIPIVIITLGAEGSLLTTKDDQLIIPSYKIKKIVDTTGAGDTFNGAFTYAYWIKEWDLIKSCKFANAAAALKIKSLGARTGIPNENEILRFISSHNT
jgi:ribokinase